MARHRLRVTEGQAAGTSIDVGDELVVGRREEGPGMLAGDREISRRHARIYAEPGGGLAVEDLGSTNGTFVDGERVTGSAPLPDGATLKMGQTTLVVEAVEEAAQPDAPPPPADATQIDAPPPPADATQIDRPLPPPPPPPEPPPPPPTEALPPTEPLPPTAPLPPVPEPTVPAPPGAAPSPLPPPTGPPVGAPPVGPPAGAPSSSGPPRVLIAVLVGVLALAAIGIGAVLLFTGDDEDDDRSDLPVTGPPALVKAAKAAGCTATTEASEGDEHVDSKPDYKSNPPHSGPHDPTPAGDGQYREAPPIETLVHSLEHGRIVMWFKPGDNKTREELLSVGGDDPSHMILTPNTTGMPYEAAASAWRHVLGCPKMNDKVPAAVRAFRDAYRDKGPERVP